MTDLIDREALIKAYLAAHKGPPGGAFKLIQEAPAVDAVEVVRCGECEWRDQDNCPMEFYWDTHPFDANKFCAYGRKKNEPDRQGQVVAEV